MYLKRKKPAEKADADRQLVLAYKKFMASDDGRIVLFDLMNRYGILNAHPERDVPGALERAEGRREVVLHIMAQANVDMVQFDKILKGEFQHG